MSEDWRVGTKTCPGEMFTRCSDNSPRTLARNLELINDCSGRRQKILGAYRLLVSKKSQNHSHCNIGNVDNQNRNL